MITHCLPDNLSAEQFLVDYWQKKPLLIRGGLPQLVGMFEPDDILGLALDAEATARLITQQAIAHTPTAHTIDLKAGSTLDAALEVDGNPQQWVVKQNPLVESDFKHLPEQWTVLVQNLEQWSPELGQLWQAFGFIPQWQRDDIMVSYAPQGGSVGKHYDEYDVFLAQGYGARRWQLGKYCDDTTEFLPNQPLRLLDDMGDIIFDEVLAPGDVLYVPPKLAHYGVAQDDCLTFSFGFRRPNLMQVLDNLVDIATAEPSFFHPLLLEQLPQPAGKLDTASVQQIKAQLLAMLQSSQGDDLIAQAVCEVVSKRQYDLLTPEETVTLDELQEAIDQGAMIRPDFNSRLIYTEIDGKLTLYANGQCLDDISIDEASLLKRLANGHSLSGQQLGLGKQLPLETIMAWLENGWVWLDDNG